MRTRSPSNLFNMQQLESRRLCAAPPAIAIGNATLLEGNSGAESAQLTVTLSKSWQKAISVNFSTEDSSATAGADYQATSSTVTFASGQTSKTINVPILGDRSGETDETLLVRLTSTTRGTIIDGSGLVTIVDDEPRVSINDAGVYEGNSGTTSADFLVTLSRSYDLPVSVTYATSDNSATTADNDYAANSGSLTFAPGETSKTISVLVNGDATQEYSEDIYVNISGAPAYAVISRSQAYGTIYDDDTPVEDYYYDWGYYDYYYWDYYYWY